MTGAARIQGGHRGLIDPRMGRASKWRTDGLTARRTKAQGTRPRTARSGRGRSPSGLSGKTSSAFPHPCVDHRKATTSRCPAKTPHMPSARSISGTRGTFSGVFPTSPTQRNSLVGRITPPAPDVPAPSRLRLPGLPAPEGFPPSDPKKPAFPSGSHAHGHRLLR